MLWPILHLSPRIYTDKSRAAEVEFLLKCVVMQCNTETIRVGEINNEIHSLYYLDSGYTELPKQNFTIILIAISIESYSFRKNIENARNKYMECHMLLLLLKGKFSYSDRNTSIKVHW